MPELPEVETMRRGILAAEGGKIIVAEKIRCRKRPISITPSMPTLRRRVQGKMIREIFRIGKRVVIRIESSPPPTAATTPMTPTTPNTESEPCFLVFEPRMTGLVLVAGPPTREHLRFRLQLSGCDIDEICYWDRRGLGQVRLLTPQQLDEQLGPGKLGPDALKISPAEFFQTFAAARQEIKVALLDQKKLAGVGNLYASEMLHAARIHPQQRGLELTRRQSNRLHHQMLTILHEAIRYEGSTLSDGTYRNALNQDGGYQNCHQVYDRENQNCSRCRKGQIQRIVQAQRATFYCPRCQPLRS